MGFNHGPEEEVGDAVSDAELTDSRVRADGTKLVGLVRVERQLRGGSFGYLKDAIRSKRLVGERQLAGIEPSMPAFRR